jgi:hypothetical protein
MTPPTTLDQAIRRHCAATWRLWDTEPLRRPAILEELGDRLRPSSPSWGWHVKEIVGWYWMLAGNRG